MIIKVQKSVAFIILFTIILSSYGGWAAQTKKVEIDKYSMDLQHIPEEVHERILEIVNQGSPQFPLAFHTYEQMVAELQQIANDYPTITTLHTLGQSVQGRSVLGLKVTDNPAIEEFEPEVRICGNHHGDELMSLELPLLLAWHLVENYASDPSIADLVNNREIWIIPSVNPDGRVAVMRRNANNVDLNRDYGYMWGGAGGSPSPFSQPETQIIRAHALENNFVLSLSFHCSGDIVNYIWNYKGDPVADHDVVVLLSEQYGSHNGYWVVEGYDWYQTRGDTNDFSYGCRGDIDWTIEVQNSGVDIAWSLNRDEMLEIIDAADMGLTGIVTDENTGDPINATIWVEEAYWPCFTDPILGDYHKPLLPGTYTVHFRANGYEEDVHTIEIIDSDEPTVFDVALSPGGEYFAHEITWVNYYDPYSYPSNFINNPTEAISALGSPDDVCSSLGKGGTIVVDMKDEIIDVEDAVDFIVYEADGNPDGYSVYGSIRWQGPFRLIGTGIGTTEFDLAVGSLQRIRYLKIIDDNDGSAYDTNPGCDIDAIQNLALNPPNTPPDTPEVPAGPTTVYTGYEYSYSTNTTDPELHHIYYQWDWGDEISEWIGPFSSGEEVTESHTWDINGDYELKVKAKDDPNGDGDLSDGLESDWSISLLVTVKKTGDVNGDGIVDVVDFLSLLAAWGPCDDCDNCPADFDGNCVVDVNDFLILLANWTE